MKKFFYTLLVIAVASFSFVSCADEEIKAKEEINTSSGSGSDRGF
jgi:hypothetical protein